MRRTKAFLLGAGTVYFLDPARGKRRRHELRDRTRRSARRAGRFSTKKTRFALGHARGLVARTRRTVSPRHVATDDKTVEQRIRSDVLRDVGLGRQDLEIRVEHGVVTLRGDVAGKTLAEDLISRVGDLPGVVDVAAMLRVTDRAA